jgi:hypothetical protein
MPTSTRRNKGRAYRGCTIRPSQTLDDVVLSRRHLVPQNAPDHLMIGRILVSGRFWRAAAVRTSGG